MFLDIFSRDKEKLIVGGLVTLVLLTALNVIVSRSNRPTSPSVTATTKTAALSLQTSSTKVDKGQEFQVEVVLDPGEDTVDAADVVLTYDTTKLEAVSVTAGTLFVTYPMQSTTGGKVQISGFSLPAEDGSSQAVTQEGTVGSVTFKAKVAGVAQISFDTDRTVVANVGKDVLKKASGTSVTVK